jgi:hypothetical protein
MAESPPLRLAQGARGRLVLALCVFITVRADFLLPFHGEH